MEEAAGSEASFCLQSILPPPEYFPPPRLRRAAGGVWGAPGSRRFPASGGEQRGRARLLSAPAFLCVYLSSPGGGTPVAASAAGWGRSGRARAACSPACAAGSSLGAGAGPSQQETRGLPSFISQSKGGKKAKNPRDLVAAFCELLPLGAEKG